MDSSGFLVPEGDKMIQWLASMPKLYGGLLEIPESHQRAVSMPSVMVRHGHPFTLADSEASFPKARHWLHGHCSPASWVWNKETMRFTWINPKFDFETYIRSSKPADFSEHHFF